MRQATTPYVSPPRISGAFRGTRSYRRGDKSAEEGRAILICHGPLRRLGSAEFVYLSGRRLKLERSALVDGPFKMERNPAYDFT